MLKLEQVLIHHVFFVWCNGYSLTKTITQLSCVWLSCGTSKQTGLHLGNICPLQAFMGKLNLVCFEGQAWLTLLTSLFWWKLHCFLTKSILGFNLDYVCTWWAQCSYYALLELVRSGRAQWTWRGPRGCCQQKVFDMLQAQEGRTCTLFQTQYMRGDGGWE